METGIFEELYKKGAPPWNIDRPQREIMQLAKRGRIGHRVLDVGCGTGDNVLYLAEAGHETWGLDIVPTAITLADQKAKEHGLDATFLVWDVLRLDELHQIFDSIIDSGLFHVLSDEERPAFTRGLASVLKPEGTYFMLCFSEHEPGDWGPRRVTQEEIRATFKYGWRIDFVREAVFETNLGPEGCRAWLASITLIEKGLALEAVHGGHIM